MFGQQIERWKPFFFSLWRHSVCFSTSCNYWIEVIFDPRVCKEEEEGKKNVNIHSPYCFFILYFSKKMMIFFITFVNLKLRLLQADWLISIQNCCVATCWLLCKGLRAARFFFWQEEQPCSAVHRHLIVSEQVSLLNSWSSVLEVLFVVHSYRWHGQFVGW